MKKCFAIILCAFVFLSVCAHAEAAYDTLSIKVSDITVSDEGQSVSLLPTAEATLGLNKSGDHGWIQIAVFLNGEESAALQLEYTEEKFLASAAGAQDCVVMEDRDHIRVFNASLLGQESAEGGNTVLSFMRAMLSSEDSAAEFLDSISGEGLAVTMAGDNEYDIHAELEGYIVECRLEWIRGGAEQVPFDLSGKNMVRFVPYKGLFGSGDIANALQTSLMQLMADESVRDLMVLLQAGVPGQQ